MSDWTSVLMSALDEIRYGIVLLDKNFEARFINRAYYGMFALKPPSPGMTYRLSDLIAHASSAGVYDTGGQAMDDYIRERLALIRNGTQSAMHLKVSFGRILNFESKILPDGGRMLTFDDITDLVQTTDKLRVLATVDDLTKVLNRRHFLDFAEDRVQPGAASQPSPVGIDDRCRRFQADQRPTRPFRR